MTTDWRNDALVPVVQGLPARHLQAAAAVSVALPAIGAVALDGPLAIGSAVLLVVSAAGISAVWRLRAYLRALPLEIAPVGAQGTLDGRPAWWFRARLGLGRYVAGGSAEVEWRAADGTIVVCDVVQATGPRIGAWTVLAVDRTGRVGDGGSFVVRVHADEPGRRWTSERIVARAAIAVGRFGPPIDGRRLVRAAGWADVAAS